MKIFLLLCFFSFSQIAFSVETEFSGNIEGQARHSWNNDLAKEDLLLNQDWEQENFFLVYSNLNGKASFENSKLEGNLFVRHAKSPLYREQYLATQVFNFPNKLVARDMFKLQHRHQEEDYQNDSILNKLYYEWTMGSHRASVGRLYINYGQGEIFNPINPFNQPTGLTNISQVAQGNDGGMVKFFLTEEHSVEFYALGDKSINNYEDGEISQTFWAHSEFQWTESFQLDYVLGRDQKRDKAGIQMSYQLEEAMIFTQALYQTELKEDDTGSHNLLDVMLGFDQQLTSKWHLRLESGYQKINRFNSLVSIGDRFLPSEYFVALANQYEAHPLVKLTGTVVTDIKTKFVYLIARSTFDLGNDMEADLFGFSPVVRGDDPENLSQKLVTTDVGVSLRAFF